MANVRQQIETELNAAVARASDADRRANLELVRAYLLNDAFRSNLHEYVYARTAA